MKFIKVLKNNWKSIIPQFHNHIEAMAYQDKFPKIKAEDNTDKYVEMAKVVMKEYKDVLEKLGDE